MHITPFYRPSIGGVEYIVYHTAKELSRRGYEIHVVTTCCDNRWRKIAELGTVIEENIVIHRLEPSFIKVGYATIMKGLKKALQNIKPDIVHCHNLHPHLFQTMKWKNEIEYKLIAQLHFPIATGIDHFSAKLLLRFVMWKLAREQQKVNAFIAHTNLEKQWLVSEGIRNEIYIIRYPCVPDELFNYEPEIDIHDRLGASTVITYISRIHPRKGQHLLLEATKYLKRELRDFKIYIAGPTSDHAYLLHLKKLINVDGLEQLVIIEPRALNEHEKLDAITTADIFACTPIQDIHPIVLLEAMALGTPIVTTAIGAISEIVKLNEVLVRNLHAEAVAKRIIHVLNTKNSIIQKLRAIAEARRCSQIVEDLINLYNKILQ